MTPQPVGEDTWWSSVLSSVVATRAKAVASVMAGCVFVAAIALAVCAGLPGWMPGVLVVLSPFLAFGTWWGGYRALQWFLSIRIWIKAVALFFSVSIIVLALVLALTFLWQVSVTALLIGISAQMLAWEVRSDEDKVCVMEETIEPEEEE